MAEQWANRRPEPAPPGGRDLYLDLDLSGPEGIRSSLIRALRDAVRSGRLAPGTRLPPSRTLAVDLGVARNTVADAYGELVAEGWLTARQGSGTRVAPRTAPATTRSTPPRGGSARGTAPRAAQAGTATSRSAQADTAQARTAQARAGTVPGGSADARGGAPTGGWGRSPFAAGDGITHSLYAGSPDVSAFPRSAWIAATRRALTRAPSEAFGYGDPRGRVELRHALADYLARARGVRTDPDRIVVCAGFVQGLSLLSRVLRADGARRLAVEGYGLAHHRNLITAAGLHTDPLTVDRHGARVDDLAQLPRCRAVLLTPAHQFPTGVPLHPDRRAAVVDWARATGGLVLEDDYDGEFRYDRQPVGALQGLDPERVVYLGTASKSLAPGLRLGWMALPERLVDRVVAAKNADERHPAVVDQLTLAEFIGSGGYDRHLRAMRLRYRRRRDRLVAELADRAPSVQVSGIAAGLHAVLRLPPGTEREAVNGAGWMGLAVQGLDDFRYPGSPAAYPDGLVVGYGTPPDHAFSGALDSLCQLLDALG
ncbi:PLP-dependent aminotransferase family protein [Streptacidiphilus sp. EB129]|uniref:MocR-like pyridoxine biosynthesis transcription factor PdxR n=1 Tax=Streptacidiphilus sp. EB129 TaxID=3156262 RepID=UPI0035192321